MLTDGCLNGYAGKRQPKSGQSSVSWSIDSPTKSRMKCVAAPMASARAGPNG